jgi:hypothetical protein
VTGFDPGALLRVLHQHDVRYVLIGGLAAALRGSATPTFDVDITPATGADNLARLSEALKDLDARIRSRAPMATIAPASDPVVTLQADHLLSSVTLPACRPLGRSQVPALYSYRSGSRWPEA